MRQNNIMKTEIISRATGWYGRANEDKHTAKHTKVHFVKNFKPLCGYRPHKSMSFQWNSTHSYVFDYVECAECKRRAIKENDKKYRSTVKKKYPDAKCGRDGAFFFVYSGTKDLGAGFSEQAAWCSAFIYLRDNKH